ncbi:MAG: septation regulator SpoVG [Thermodesulfobacteriota bacterium]|nr:septation regulator SpoVG [Thermodesulfobacteriota bacterium]
MEVTEVRIFPIDDKKVKAFATITFDNCFVVRDIKIIDGINGLFVAMPSKRTKDGTFKDTAHPVNNELRLNIEARVLEAYRKETGRGTSIAV